MEEEEGDGGLEGRGRRRVSIEEEERDGWEDG